MNDAKVPSPTDAVTTQVADFQQRMIEIQLGKRPPPEWFKRTSFDTGTVTIDGIGTFLMVAATAGTMEKLERAESGSNEEGLLEIDAVVEAIEEIPESVKLRRPVKVNNKTFEAGQTWKNFWAVDSRDARVLVQALLGGKVFAMLKMAMLWLSKIDVPTMIGMDPEPGSSAKEGGRPTA